MNRSNNLASSFEDFYQPLQEDEFEQSAVVQIIFPAEPKLVFCEFDWELDDDLEEFMTKLIEEEELSEEQRDAFKDFVKEKVREAKKANREAREVRRKALEEMSEVIKAAFQNMRFFKFYPVSTSDTPDVSSVKVLWEGSQSSVTGLPRTMLPGDGIHALGDAP
ncbi:unnamed protein product [Ilex paraguariensis]|uniref:Uncharacterized protein n=1 Tax=Ilex paraguariensis TaxID=185542 RepID=A0ABC8UEF7_9AQUA